MEGVRVESVLQVNFTARLWLHTATTKRLTWTAVQRLREPSKQQMITHSPRLLIKAGVADVLERRN